METRSSTPLPFYRPIYLSKTPPIYLSADAVAACVGFVAFVIRARIRKSRPTGSFGQVAIFAAGLLLFAQLGVILVAPSGPGSGMPVFLIILLPCLLFLVTGSSLIRTLALLATCACVVGVVSEHRARQHFGETMRARQAEVRQKGVAEHEGTPNKEFSEPPPATAFGYAFGLFSGLVAD